MPKKKHKESPSEQSERFRKEAQKLIDAGELSPTEADKTMDKLLSKAAKPPPQQAGPDDA